MLPLLLVTAALAAATVLPLGGSAHGVALRIAAPTSDATMAVAELGAAIGAALAPLVIASSRVRRLVVEARAPGSELLVLVLAAAAGGVGFSAVEPLARDMAQTATGAGLGLLATSIAIGSIGIAPAPRRRSMTPRAAALAAAGLAAGALPGSSPIALALAALVWCGVAEIDALEIAALLALPIHVIGAVRVLRADALSALEDQPGPPALAGAVAMLVACAALLGGRRLARDGRLAMLSLWTATLGFAVLGWAYVAAP